MQSINELLAVEANTIEEELDEELSAKVEAVTKSPLSNRELGVIEKEVEAVEADDANGLAEKKKKKRGKNSTGEEKEETARN